MSSSSVSESNNAAAAAEEGGSQDQSMLLADDDEDEDSSSDSDSEDQDDDNDSDHDEESSTVEARGGLQLSDGSEDEDSSSSVNYENQGDDSDDVDNYMDEEPSTKKARTELKQILWDFVLERNGNDDKVVLSVVEILRQHNGLSKIPFFNKPYSRSATIPLNPRTTSHGKIKLYPFTYLLIAGASLDILKEIYEFGTQVLFKDETMPDRNSYTVIQTACLHRADETDLISFLVEQFRKSFRHIDRVGTRTSFPLHIALDAFAPLETIQKLVEASPETLRSEDNVTGMDSLQRALWFQSPADEATIHFLVDLWLSAIGKNAKLFVGNRYIVTDDTSKALTRVILKCKEVTCFPTAWSLAGWIHLVSSISKSSRLKKLLVKLPGNLPLDQSRPASQALHDLLERETNIEWLSLCRPECAGTEHTKFLVRGIALPCGLRNLELRHTDFSGMEEWQSQTTISGSSIRWLSIFSCSFRPGFLCEFLHHIGELPCLEELDINVKLLLGGEDSTDSIVWQSDSPLRSRSNLRIRSLSARFTKAMVQILQRNKLRKLRMTRCLNSSTRLHFDMTILCQELKRNTSLREIYDLATFTDELPLLSDTLQLNASLQSISIDACSYDTENLRDREMIDHYLAVNRCGREELRARDFSCRDLLTLLAQAMQEDSNERNRCERGRGTYNFLPTENRSPSWGIAYELLRESPSIWSHCSDDASALMMARRGGKRKRKGRSS